MWEKLAEPCLPGKYVKQNNEFNKLQPFPPQAPSAIVGALADQVIPSEIAIQVRAIPPPSKGLCSSGDSKISK